MELTIEIGQEQYQKKGNGEVFIPYHQIVLSGGSYPNLNVNYEIVPQVLHFHNIPVENNDPILVTIGFAKNSFINHMGENVKYDFLFFKTADDIYVSYGSSKKDRLCSSVGLTVSLTDKYGDPVNLIGNFTLSLSVTPDNR